MLYLQKDCSGIMVVLGAYNKLQGSYSKPEKTSVEFILHVVVHVSDLVTINSGHQTSRVRAQGLRLIK